MKATNSPFSAFPDFKTRLLSVGLGAALVAGATTALPFVAQAGPTVPNVLIIQIDGHRLDRTLGLLDWEAGPTINCPSVKFEPVPPTFCEATQNWTCVPTLCDRMHMILSETGPGKTLTRPQTVQMLTGLVPDTTGVHVNSGGRVPVGMSIFSNIETALGGTVNFGVVGSNRFLHQPFRFDRKSGILEKEFLSSRGRDRILFSGRTTTEKTVEMIDQLRLRDAPFLLVSHLKIADSAGHKVGTRVDSVGIVDGVYNEALVNSWIRIGEIMDQLDARGILDETVILAHPDHGFLGRNHQRRGGDVITDLFFASNVPLDQTATGVSLLDVTATALDAMGIDPTAQIPPLDGISRLAP